MKSTTANQNAFTLIELLVVLAIVTVLAALLLPVLSRTMEKAHQITCLKNVKQINLAIQMYVQENNQRMCGERMSASGDISWPPPPKPNDKKVWTWRVTVLPYTGEVGTNGAAALWDCPTRPPNWDMTSDEVDDDVQSSYGIAEDTLWANYGNGGVHSYADGLVVKPSQLLLLGDSQWSGPGISARFLKWDHPWLGYWHRSRCNFAFWDGHGEPLRAIKTVTDSPDDCMWGHDIWPHSVHLDARNNATPEYR